MEIKTCIHTGPPGPELPTPGLDTLKMSATSAGDLDLRFLMISPLVSGLILGMLTEAMLSIN